MIRDFDFSEESVGLYAGLLTATFAICQFISSYFWGLLSDKYGRKAALIIGSVVSAFAIIMFGTSTGYLQAVSARSLAGIFNGNIGVARAYVADITNGQNRGFAFSIFAIAFSAGIIVGSICGGALIQTFDLDDDGGHRQSVGVIKWWIFDEEFPYLAPCVVGMLISMISVCFTVVNVQDIAETKQIDNGSTSSSTKWVKNGNTTIPMIEPTKNGHEYSTSKSLPTFSSFGGAENDHITDHSNGTNATNRTVDDSHSKSNSLNIYTQFNDEGMHLGASLIDSNAMGTNALFEGAKSLTFFNGEQSKLLDDDRDHFDEDAESESNPNIDSLSSLFMKTQVTLYRRRTSRRSMTFAHTSSVLVCCL